MRKRVVFGIGAASAIVLVAQFAPSLLSPAKRGAPPPSLALAASSEARTAARRMLSETTPHRFELVVLGRDLDDRVIEFRAHARSDGGLRPAYGQVRAVCDDVATRPSCWTLSLLEIDGRVVDLDQADALIETPATAATETPRRTADASLAAPVVPRNAAAEVDQVATLGRGTDASSIDGAASATPRSVSGASRVEGRGSADQSTPKPTHRVIGARVNARGGPGLEFRVLRVLSDGEALVQIPTDGASDDWLKFRAVAAGESEAVWVYSALVRSLAAE